jgi:hypothetical protein
VRGCVGWEARSVVPVVTAPAGVSPGSDARLSPRRHHRSTVATTHLRTGDEKAKFHWTKVALLSIIAGCYVGLGFTLCLIVGGNMPK